MSVLLISRTEVEELLTIEKAIDVVESAFVEYARGESVTPPVLSLPIVAHEGGIDFKMCYLHRQGIAGGKAVSFFANNAALGLPSVMGTALLFDGKTGALLSIMDGGYLTTVRTGALGAIAAKYLANKDAKVVGVIGSGTQARIQLVALTHVRAVSETRVYSRSPEHSARYAQEMSTELNVPVQAVDSASRAVDGADIIITATNAHEPLVRKESLKAGAHITAIGADGEGMQELDPGIFHVARTFCDSLPQCKVIGELQHPFAKGIISDKDVVEIGDVIAGKAEGRKNDQEITVFDSTGVAIQDLAAEYLVYTLAEERGVGTVVEI